MTQTQGSQAGRVQPETFIQIWKFHDAPEDLRSQVPGEFAGGWVALYSNGLDEIVLRISDVWDSLGLPISIRQIENRGTLLACPELPDIANAGRLLNLDDI